MEPAAPYDRAAEYEDFCNTHRPHRTLKQAAPLRPLPDNVTDLNNVIARYDAWEWWPLIGPIKG